METRVVRDLVAEGVLRIEDGNHGNDRPRPDEFVDSGVAFVRAADMSSGVVRFQGAGRINEAARARIRKGVGAPGDVILSHKGTVGRVAVAPADSPEFVCSPQTTFWRSLDPQRLDQRYLAYVLRSAPFQHQLGVLKGQTDMAPYVSLTDQRGMRIPLPLLAEQRAIAEVLGALDDKIAANERVVATSCGLSASIVRAAASVGPERRLSEVLRLNYGKALPASSRVPGDVPVFGSGGVTGHHDVALVAEPGVVVGRKGTAGAVHWVDRPHFPIDTTYYVVPLGSLSSEVAFHLLADAGLGALNSDSAVPGLNREEAYSQRVQVPEGPDLGRLDIQIKPLFAARTAKAQESALLASTRDALLPLLMSGKLRVKDAEKQISEVL